MRIRWMVRLPAIGIAIVAGFASGCGSGSSGGSSSLPAPTTTASPSATPSAAATGGGTIVIVVPTPSPVTCSPQYITVAVGQKAIVNCNAGNYVGYLNFTVDDPTIASVVLADGTYTFFYVTGIAPGSTTLSVTYPAGGFGTATIVVSDAAANSKPVHL